MLILNITLTKQGTKYKAVFSAEENGQVIYMEDWDEIKTRDILTRRAKTILLDNKGLTISLNVLNTKKNQRTKSSTQ